MPTPSMPAAPLSLAEAASQLGTRSVELPRASPGGLPDQQPRRFAARRGGQLIYRSADAWNKARHLSGGGAALAVGAFTFALPDYLAINFAYQTVHVIGSAMHPTVDDNDYLVAEKLPYLVHPPRRGEIIIMRDPFDPSRDFIKRVVGLPGESILIQSCRVFVNQRHMIEPYVRDGWTRCDPPWPASGHAAILGPNEFFVMGDNRDFSTDSRAFGPVVRRAIEARVSTRILPLDHAGPLDSPRGSFA